MYYSIRHLTKFRYSAHVSESLMEARMQPRSDGSQKLVQDFITGIFLLMENAMQVGDWITVSGVSGTVEYLSIRTVRLRGLDGSLYTVPFSSVTTVNNSNRGIGNAAIKVAIASCGSWLLS